MADPAIQSLSNCTLHHNPCCSIITIQSILLYCSACFSKLLSVTNWVKLARITNTTAQVIGPPIANLTELNTKSNNIGQDIRHPVNRKVNPLSSGRRYRSSGFRRTLLGKILIPADLLAINVSNGHCFIGVYCSVCVSEICYIRSLVTNLPTGH